jgi:hypothetical protein
MDECRAFGAKHKSGIPAATFQRQRRDLKIAWGIAPGTRIELINKR